MVLAVTFPGAILFGAFGQLWNARKVDRAWRDKFKDLGQDTCDCLGMDRAFFVLVGGFEITKCTGHEHKRTTLTAEIFKEFLNADKINERSFDKDAIVDKGKSSNIAKLISSFQAI